MPEPTLADVMARIDNLDRVLTLEVRALHAEVRATKAELGLAITTLTGDLRDLWTEHLAHGRPDEPTS